ncbi:alpha/beta fold hydrolase [Amycolatopsis thermophila]|uniref:Pimeloyl-ACP methyl ester carboxylesterase n=1 Tax=Amycolatopsis thermophila TaxID=206084 RepID=A0ABU0F127_9PSEU|nr:alpha/beta hydrolase [Amycolatopsis thermophila]MDQ0381208.1 pimeloyl-ACP methyl ester carboxylesterase [Amycolatopsis thermophila]
MPETYVLVPGAWHGAWCWRPVAGRLRAAGHRVFAVTLPGLADGDDRRGRNLSDTVDFLAAFLDRHDLTDVTLVGHSWGGYPITGAAHRIPRRLRRLVYCNAFVPERGRPLVDDVPPGHAALFKQLASASADGSIVMPYEVWQHAFVQDLAEPVRKLLHDLLVPQPMSYFDQALDAPDVTSLGIPVSYLAGREDLAMPPGEFAWSPRFPRRLGVDPVELPGGHESFLTRPDDFVRALSALR